LAANHSPLNPEDIFMKNLCARITFPAFLTIALLVLCVGLSFAGVIDPAVAALPFVGIGAVKVRDPFEMIRTLKYTHSAATVVDTCYLLNTRVMLAMNSAAISVSNIFMYKGLIEYASETGVAWTTGDKLYWDNTNFRFTKTVGTNTLCGIAAEDKASAAAVGMVLLDQAS
jgi:predicted RecA/RadA family phage recombinase